MRTRLWFIFMVLGLLSVLIGLFFFIFQSQHLTQINTQAARKSFNTNNLYHQANFLVVAQELYEQKYLINPTSTNYAIFQSGVANFSNSLQYLSQESADDDIAAVQQMIAIQQQYQDATQRMVDAIGAHNMPLANQIDTQQVSPLYLVLQNLIDVASTKEYSRALTHMDDVITFEAQSSSLTPIVSGVGFILLVILGFLLYRSQQSLARAQQIEIARFKQSSLTDNLTQIGNHRAYEEAYQQHMVQKQSQDAPLSLALIDVDEFKQYNDQYGHAYGDHILKALAHVLGTSRKEDQAFRIGGDEFAMILHDTSIGDAAKVLERIRETVKQQLVGITISIGIAELSQDGSNLSMLQEQADAALYEAKRLGRNCLVSFPRIEETKKVLASEQDQHLRDLLQEKQITPLFQPIWDFEHHEILAFEALMRPHEKYHFSGAQEAFETALKIGRVPELDSVYFEAMCAHAHELPSNALFFFNISAQALESEKMMAMMLEMISTVGLAPRRIVLEINDRAVSLVGDLAKEVRRLRCEGFKIALDHVGTGDSSLIMMSQLVMDYIKLDRSIVGNASVDKAASAILAGIVAIAQKTDCYVIAEIVEDHQSLESIHQSMADKYKQFGVQGILLGQPSEKMFTPSEIAHIVNDLMAA